MDQSRRDLDSDWDTAFTVTGTESRYRHRHGDRSHWQARAPGTETTSCGPAAVAAHPGPTASRLSHGGCYWLDSDSDILAAAGT